MDWTCSVHTRKDEKLVQNFVCKLKGRYHSEDTAVDGRMILKWILIK
jgi:hypothetical protein